MISYKDQMLYHHGIKGQKWGVRRYQNKDGSLTSAGKKRYSDEMFDSMRKEASRLKKSGDKKGARKAERAIRRLERERNKIDNKFVRKKLKEAKKKYKNELEINNLEDAREYAAAKALIRAGHYASSARPNGSNLNRHGQNTDLAARRIARQAQAYSREGYARMDLLKGKYGTNLANKHLKNLKTPTGRTVSFTQRYTDHVFKRNMPLGVEVAYESNKKKKKG